MIEGFLLGVIAMASFTASAFFLRFWKDTRDTLFFAFVIFFSVEGLIRVASLFFARPNEGSPWIYLARLLALIFLLVSILKKNYGAGSGR
ncbi:MAG TPA: DUF5985 family protein [Terriglobales bacterium]|jgi:uncharacterized membrane protein HdeD (DUF308 family)